MLRKCLKVLHEVGAVGVLGSFAACLVLVMTAPTRSLVAYAAVREGIASIAKWLLVPSLALVVISGLLAIAANRAYVDAGWAWIKALLGIGLFEGTLMTVAATARQAADLTALAAAGSADPASLAGLLRTERGGLWLLLSLSLANIILAVWRPRLKRSPPAPSGSAVAPPPE
jgi:hypothetical protein